MVVWPIYLKVREVLGGRVDMENGRWILNDGGLGMWIGIWMESKE